ncbi:MAG: hypothetical protein ACJ8BW_39465, partial [Ktedonobacteraceae bacterium]
MSSVVTRYRSKRGANLALTSDGRKASLNGQKNYYNLPLIKKSHWTWEVILYFFIGGIAGGSDLAATLADLLGSAKDASLVRAGRYLAFVGIIISPILLIK